MEWLRQLNGTTVNKRADFTYNADGSEKTVTRYNAGSTLVATSTYGYDGMGRSDLAEPRAHRRHGHQLHVGLRRRMAT